MAEVEVVEWSARGPMIGVTLPEFVVHVAPSKSGAPPYRVPLIWGGTRIGGHRGGTIFEAPDLEEAT